MAIQKHRSGSHTPKNQPTGRVAKGMSRKQQVVIALLVGASFLGAYGFAHARSGSVGTTAVASAAPNATAQVQGGVQKIAVDVTLRYNPSVVRLKAGVPAEITFSQAQGCTALVQSKDLGFQEDLSAGPKTVKLAGLQPGTYNFACGMNMVRGQVVVE